MSQATASVRSLRAFAGASEPTRSDLLRAPIRWPRPSLLDVDVRTLPGVGAKTAAVLRDDLGIETVERLRWHLPRRFDELPPIVSMSELEPGVPSTVIGVVGTVGRFRRGPGGGRAGGRGAVEATVADGGGAGSIKAVWFNQPWIADELKPGQTVRLTGAREGARFVVATLQPEGEDSTVAPTLAAWGPKVPAYAHLREPIPVHPAGERIGAKAIRGLVWKALSGSDAAGDPLPVGLRKAYGLPSRSPALRAAGFPGVCLHQEASALPGGGDAARRSISPSAPARRRLAFEELLLHQVELLRRRLDSRASRSRAFGPPGDAARAWIDRLPFEPTSDQLFAMGEIDADLALERPMRRLLMGEVGSGKTVVAVHAMMRAIEAGCQAALLAPTEVLAEQHAVTLSRLLAGSGATTALLTGSVAAKPRREALAGLASGAIDIAVGTHALIEDSVEFANLGVYVVDEQHRFGVAQRAALASKISEPVPHVLHMSATPIPRTMALLAYGDLDLTELRRLPAGRRAPVTTLVAAGERESAFARIRTRLDGGERAYVICPLIDESDAVTAKAVNSEAERLRDGELSGYSIAVLHGRLSANDKRRAMEDFATGRVSVLVSTTVVEVGVDVPEASTIAIEGAEKFGLAQLHQLRGRVGRGPYPSECLLLTEGGGEKAMARLRAMEAESDGFRLAELDLELRGAGELLGRRQHGEENLLAASLPRDAELLGQAHREARSILESADDSPGPEVEILFDAAARRFGSPGRGILA